MKDHELNVNTMEKVSGGGSFFCFLAAFSILQVRAARPACIVLFREQYSPMTQIYTAKNRRIC